MRYPIESLYQQINIYHILFNSNGYKILVIHHYQAGRNKSSESLIGPPQLRTYAVFWVLRLMIY